MVTSPLVGAICNTHYVRISVRRICHQYRRRISLLGTNRARLTVCLIEPAIENRKIIKTMPIIDSHLNTVITKFNVACAFHFDRPNKIFITLFTLKQHEIANNLLHRMCTKLHSGT